MEFLLALIAFLIVVIGFSMEIFGYDYNHNQSGESIRREQKIDFFVSYRRILFIEAPNNNEINIQKLRKELFRH